MSKMHGVETIEDKANEIIFKLSEFRIQIGMKNFNVFNFYNLMDETIVVKKELMKRIYILSDLIATGSELSDERKDHLRLISSVRGDALIHLVIQRQKKMQDERICRRIGLIMLHANITNTISDIESRIYEELTVINQMENTALASQG